MGLEGGSAVWVGLFDLLGFGLVAGDGDADGLGAGGLGDRHDQDSVLELRRDTGAVDLLGELEPSGPVAPGALLPDPATLCLEGLRLGGERFGRFAVGLQ